MLTSATKKSRARKTVRDSRKEGRTVVEDGGDARFAEVNVQHLRERKANICTHTEIMSMYARTDRGDTKTRNYSMRSELA